MIKNIAHVAQQMAVDTATRFLGDLSYMCLLSFDHQILPYLANRPVIKCWKSRKCEGVGRGGGEESVSIKVQLLYASKYLCYKTYNYNLVTHARI